MKIVIDTNFFIYSIEYKIFQQLEKPGIEIILPQQVKWELEKLSNKGKMKDRDAAKLALHLINKLNIKILKINARSADEAVLKTALQENACLATLDKILSKKAQNRGVKVMEIRQKKYMCLE